MSLTENGWRMADGGWRMAEGEGGKGENQGSELFFGKRNDLRYARR